MMRLLIVLLLLTSGAPNRAPPVVAPPVVAPPVVAPPVVAPPVVAPPVVAPPVVTRARVTYRPPLAGPLVVTRDFDPPATRFGPGHRGVDLAATAGSPVLASADGVVTYAGELAGRIVVSITHADGIRTTYEPLAGLSVHLHASVSAGALLGTLAPGHPGCSAIAPMVCLHWGALRPGAGGSTYLDPLLLLDREPVTLLPPVDIDCRC